MCLLLGEAGWSDVTQDGRSGMMQGAGSDRLLSHIRDFVFYPESNGSH